MLIVRDKTTAADEMDSLISLPNADVVAWDTETTHIRFAQQSSVGNGRILCSTTYAGHSKLWKSPCSFLFTVCMVTAAAEPRYCKCSRGILGTTNTRRFGITLSFRSSYAW